MSERVDVAPGADRRGRAHHTVQVALLATGAGLLPPAPERDLAHGEADQHEQHGRLDVRGVGDGELVVGLGEEEVEPGGARQRGDDSGRPDAGGRRGDDQQHQPEGGVGVRHDVPERAERRARGKGHDGGDADDQRPVCLQEPLDVHLTMEPRPGRCGCDITRQEPVRIQIMYFP
jgi:hypothetical protein